MSLPSLIRTFSTSRYHNEEAHPIKSGQSQYEKHNADYNLIGSCSQILNASLTDFETHLTTDCCIKVCLTVDLKPQ